MKRAELNAHLAPHGLMLLGDLPPGEDLVGYAVLALIGPDEPRFWEVYAQSPEYGDGAPDPLDRWSRRVLGTVAADLGAEALFPFGGPPWHPFIGWAQETGRIFASPVTLLVHETRGLFVSFRGALALREAFEDSPAPAGNPCTACAGAPCRSACPVEALTAEGYDVARCHAHLDTPAGQECLRGCLVRRACPIGAGRRPEAQSAYHMSQFHPRSR